MKDRKDRPLHIYFASSLSSTRTFDFGQISSPQQQYVDNSCHFIAAVLAPLLEAVAVDDWYFEKLCYKSGGDIKSKDVEEGVCLRDEEGTGSGQRRYYDPRRAESILCRDWQASREDYARNQC